MKVRSCSILNLKVLLKFVSQCSVGNEVTDLFGNVIVKRINIILFDLLARCHYILNPPRMYDVKMYKTFRTEVEVPLYTMQNVFRNFLCFASLFAHLSSILNNFNCKDENWIFGK